MYHFSLIPGIRYCDYGLPIVGDQALHYWKIMFTDILIIIVA